MTQTSLLITLSVLGVASAAHPFTAPRNPIPKSLLQTKNYPGECSASEQAATKTCLDAYFATYGIDSSKGLPSFFDYMTKMNSVVEQYGAAGFDFYCDFESTLESCLGPLMTSSCMNPDGFVKMYGLEQMEALNYAMAFPMDSYMCSNKDFAKTYYACMREIDDGNYQGLIDCGNNMLKELQEADDKCVYICNTQEIGFNFELNGLCQGEMHTC